MYYEPSVVPIRQNNLVWMNQLWGKKFYVSFHITVKNFWNFNEKVNVFNIRSDTGSNLLGVYLLRRGVQEPSILVFYKDRINNRIVYLRENQSFENT